MKIRLVTESLRIDVEMPMPPRIGERCLPPGRSVYQPVIEVNYCFNDDGSLKFVGVQLGELNNE